MVHSGLNDAPRAAGAAHGPDPVGGAEPVAVELTPRGLELLEALNELFDTMSAAEEHIETPRDGHRP